MKDQSRPLPAPESESADTEKYQIYSRIEILSLLREMIATRTPVTIYFNQGDDFIVSQVLSVNPDFEEVILDFGPDQDTNQRLLKSNRLLFVTFLDHIKIQFSVTRAESTSFEGGPAFRIRLPDSVIRLQRRNFYRIETPKIDPLVCYVPLPDHPDGGVSIKIHDLSVGGVCMVTAPSDVWLIKGMTFHNCKLQIPDHGEVVTGLEIRHVEDLKDSPTPLQKIGCQFVGLPAPMVTVLQRYIIKTERDRRALT
ncbi:flagellar brake protein [Parvibium lacunae]|nr:flagellar brake protein [Parvibium lacunae]